MSLRNLWILYDNWVEVDRFIIKLIIPINVGLIQERDFIWISVSRVLERFISIILCSQYGKALRATTTTERTKVFKFLFNEIVIYIYIYILIKKKKKRIGVQMLYGYLNIVDHFFVSIKLDNTSRRDQIVTEKDWISIFYIYFSLLFLLISNIFNYHLILSFLTFLLLFFRFFFLSPTPPWYYSSAKERRIKNLHKKVDETQFFFSYIKWILVIS